jgi:hypothetical protein
LGLHIKWAIVLRMLKIFALKSKLLRAAQSNDETRQIFSEIAIACRTSGKTAIVG